MPGARTIAEIVSSAAERDFVGRAEELGAVRDAARPAGDGTLVLFLTGPGGIGKSRLLRAALGGLDGGVHTLLLDCREIEPTPQGFMRSLGGALGLHAPSPHLADVIALLAADGRPAVLALDTYERFGLLDTWLRQALLPRLPETVLTLVAGRDAPATAWMTTPGWAGLVRELRLGPLRHSESMTLLRGRGLTELQAARANGFARGHPLALELAAGAMLADPDLDIEAGPPPAVIGRLLHALLAGLPEHTIETLEAASTSRRVTEPVLRALLARPGVRAEFEALRALPFVERTPDGLMIHDVVREAVAADLRDRDPELTATYRRRAWSYFESRARRPAPERLWAVTADLIYLIQNPVLRAACFPEGSAEHTVERAVEADGPAIRAIAAAHEAPGGAELLERWWERLPESFSVARGPGGDVAAVFQLAEIGDLDDELAAADPVARAWRDHLARVPPLPGDRVLTMRRWLGRESGEMLSPAVGACWLDVKRVYMELRPRLSRLYSVMADPTGPRAHLRAARLRAGRRAGRCGRGRPPAGVARLRRGQRRRVAAPPGGRRARRRGGGGREHGRRRLRGRPDRARGRGARARRRGDVEPGHRRAPRDQRQDGRPPPREHLLQARRPHPRPGRPVAARMGHSPDGGSADGA